MKVFIFSFVLLLCFFSNVYGEGITVNVDDLKKKSTDELIAIIQQSVSTYNDSIKEMDLLRHKIQLKDQELGLHEEKSKLQSDLEKNRQNTINNLNIILSATNNLLKNEQDSKKELMELTKEVGKNADKEIRRLKQEQFWDNLEWFIRGVPIGVIAALAL